MHVLENERLIVLISAENSALEVHDKAAGVTWKQPYGEVILRSGAGRAMRPTMRVIAIEALDGGTRVSAEIAGADGAALGLTWDAALAGNALTLRLHEVRGLRQGEELELAWPGGVVSGGSGEHGYLVLPIRTGQLLAFTQTRKPEVYEDMVYGGLKMPLFGAIKGRGAVAAIVETPYDCRLRTEANVRGHYTVGPVWIIEEGRLNYRRELRLVFLADASHVEIAKAYRQQVIARGRFVSFHTKAERSGLVETLAGAVTGERRSYSLKSDGEGGLPSIRTFFGQAKELGFDRACIWFAGPSAGEWNPTEMRAEVEYARSLSPGFRLSVYTNMIDIDPASSEYDPQDVLRLRDGAPRINWYTTHTVCTPRRTARARHRMPETLEGVGRGNVYVDVEGAAPLLECYSAEHPMTREQDANYRRELLTYVKELFGSVTTEHLPHDFLCDVVDMGAYTAIYPYQVFDATVHANSAYLDAEGRDWYVYSSCPFQTIPIPLFQLVWHDSVLSMNSSGKTADSSGWLEDYPCEPMHLPLYGLLPDDLSQRSLMMSRLMRQTYYEELVEHRFLTGPRMEYTDRGLYRTRDVQMSRFGDGTIVVANFGDEPFFFDSHTPVPMHEFTIIRPGRAPVIV